MADSKFRDSVRDFFTQYPLWTGVDRFLDTKWGKRFLGFLGGAMMSGVGWIASLFTALNAGWKYGLFGAFVAFVCGALIIYLTKETTITEPEPTSYESPKILAEQTPLNVQNIKETAVDPVKAADRLLAGVPVESVLEHDEEEWGDLERIYEVDNRRGLITLKVSLKDDRSRNQNALLLLVYGYKILKGSVDVSKHHLSQGLRESGYCQSLSIMDIALMRNADLNVDLLAEDYVQAGFLRHHGLLKGGVYTITEAGIAEARRIVKEISPYLD